MFTYEDIMSIEEQMQLTESTILYLVKLGDGYVLKAISAGFEQLSCCATTREKTYWPVNTKAFLDKINTNANITKLFFGINLNVSPLRLSEMSNRD